MILPMARVQLLGPRDLLPPALAFLQGQGVLELRAPGPAVGGAPFLRPVSPSLEAAGRGRALAGGELRLAVLAARLGPPPPGVEAEALPAAGGAGWAARLAALEAEVVSLEARRAALAAEREATLRFSDLVVALAPLRHGLPPALQPELHGLVLRGDGEALSLLRGEVRRITGGEGEVHARSLDGATTGVLVVVPRAHGRALGALLFERGVDEVRLPPAYGGKPIVEVLMLLAARQRELPGELRTVDAALRRAASTVAAAAQAARAALELWTAQGRCGETRFAFVVSGYMPAERVEALRAAAAATLGERVTVLAHAPERRDYGAVPVVLRNRPWIRPFELLLALVALPRYGSVDPTPWLAVFFPLLFGLVLGDAAFGLAGVALALVARARGWGGARGRDVAAVALWCSLSAIGFGLLFGEALGELGAHVGLRPLLLDRRRAVLSLLALALAVGAVHVLTGMALGLSSALRGGRRREAVARAAKLLLLCAAAGAAAGLAGWLPRGAVRPALLAAVALLGVAVVAEGPMAALDLVLGLGNVLSYARLMALGLASAMLAEVANLVATTLEPAAAGLALGVLLHAVNFTLGLVSPTVAALRLQYVEFFEKFYDEGGEPYRPFALSG